MLPRLFRYVRLAPGLAALLLVLAILDSSWAPVFPKVAGKIQTDLAEFQNGKNPQLLFSGILWLVGIVVAVGVARDILSFFRVRVSAKFGQMITYDLRSRLYDKLQRLPVKWFDQQRTGDIMTKIVEDVPAMERVMNEGMETAVRLVFQVIMVATVLFLTNWQLTLVAMIPIPFLILAGHLSTKPLQTVNLATREAASGLNSLVNDNISGIRQIKAYHLLEAELKQFNQASERVRQANIRLFGFWAVFSPIVGSIVALGYALVLLAGAYFCMTPTTTAPGAEVRYMLSSGDLSTYLLLLWAFYSPIERVKDLHQMLQTAQTSADRVFGIMDLAPEVDLEDGDKLADVKGHVVFQNVGFSYGDRPTLHEVSLEARPGETIALVGSSGAGKSTILYLLARFYEYDSGSITIDGRELKGLAKDSLRRSLGYVTQEAFLFNGTIRENLLIAKPTASDEDIWDALRAANADGFVRRQPEGLDTEVGERGIRLSGGEKQRVSIARVLLKNPAVLLLDEATASVDNETERLIQQALDRLMKGRTSFVIAHRLSTIRSADRIYVMDQGRVVESGTHEELIGRGGLYATLCQKSFREEESAPISPAGRVAQTAHEATQAPGEAS